MNILFRLDASSSIGAGHFERCLTIARTIKSTFDTAKVVFVCHELAPVFIKKLEYAAIEYIPFRHVFQSEEHDAEQLLSIIKHHFYDYIFIDHYQLQTKWESLLRPYCRMLIALDDLTTRQHAKIDYLIDQTYGRTTEQYRCSLPENCKALLGSKYAILREEFQQTRKKAVIKRESYKSVKQVVISLGAMNTGEYTLPLLSYLLQYRTENQLSFNILILLSNSAKGLTDIKTYIAPYHFIKLQLDSTNIAEEYLQADIAIGACGTSTWERCSLGLPTIAVTLASNQLTIAKQLHEAGAHYYLGEAHSVKISDFKDAFSEITSNIDTYSNMVRKALEIVDGQGVENLLKKIQLSDVHLRLAELSDINTVYQWQSQSVIRQYSRNTQPISYDEHRAWMTKALANEHRHIFIIELKVNSRIEHVGMLRLDKFKDGYEISILVCPKHHQQGIAKRALALIPEKFKTSKIYATVLEKNLASQQLFLNSGYSKISPEEYLLQPTS